MGRRARPHQVAGATRQQAFAQELIDKIEIESLQEEVLDLFEGSLK